MATIKDVAKMAGVSMSTVSKYINGGHVLDENVEAIRNAIEVSWSRGNRNLFCEIFGYSMEDGRNRPTNSEYIARLADKVRLDFRE